MKLNMNKLYNRISLNLLRVVPQIMGFNLTTKGLSLRMLCNVWQFTVVSYHPNKSKSFKIQTFSKLLGDWDERTIFLSFCNSFLLLCKCLILFVFFFFFFFFERERERDIPFLFLTSRGETTTKKTRELIMSI